MTSLSGLRVLDLSRLLPGPIASWMLTGQGARVLKVEPIAGEPTRRLPPEVDGAGAWFASLARGQRSLALDFRHAEAAGVLERLVAVHDVVLEGFRPGVLEAMGCDPAAWVEQGVIVARLSGWGQTGPWRDRSAHDVGYVAASGALAMMERPMPLPVQLADVLAGHQAAFGVAAAVAAQATERAAGRPVRGHLLDLGLGEAALAAVVPALAMAGAGRAEPVPGGEWLTGGLPAYGAYEASDGWVSIGALEPHFLERLHSVVGAVDRATIAAWCATRSRSEIESLLASATCVAVTRIGEVGGHPQHLARGAVATVGGVTWIRPPLADATWFDGTVPRLSEHAAEALLEAGVDADTIADLVARRVVR